MSNVSPNVSVVPNMEESENLYVRCMDVRLMDTGVGSHPQHSRFNKGSGFIHFRYLKFLVNNCWVCQGSLYYQSKQGTIVGEIPQNQHRFAFFDTPPKWVYK